MKVGVFLGSINVPFSVGPANWLRCWNIMKRECSVFGTNETLTQVQKELFRRTLRRKRNKNWKVVGLQTPNPIFWDNTVWQYVDDGYQEIHGPGTGRLAHDNPGFNAGRGFTWVILKHRATGTKHCFINTHWVPPGPKVDSQWRSEMHKRSIRDVRNFMERIAKRGIICHLFGDTNISGQIQMPVWFSWTKRQGVQKIGIGLPKDVALKWAKYEMVPAPTDHDYGCVEHVILEVA